MAPLCRLLCTLVVVTAALLVQEGDSNEMVVLNLKSFTKSDTSGCRGDTGAVCEPMFTICLERGDENNRCVNGSSNNHEVYYFKKFTNIIDGMTNPVELEYTRNSGYLYIYIDDYNNDGYYPNLVTFHMDLSSLQMSHSRDIIFHNSTSGIDLDVTVTLMCNRSYYGKDCSVYCDSYNSRYTCRYDGSKRCHTGYYGDNCERIYATSNPCYYSNPCDRGTCYEGLQTKTYCDCPDGYYGDACQIQYGPTRLINRCHYSKPCNRGTCHPTGFHDYICNCPYGYTGKHCEYDVHDISTSPRPSTHTATYKPMSTSSTLPSTKNPCYYFSPCRRGACYNIGNNDYKCNCPYDYTGKHCEYLIQTKSQPVGNPCSSSHCYGGKCHVINEFKYFCECRGEFYGKNCELTSTARTETTVKNPCHKTHCQNSGTCVPDGDNFICNCAHGYSGTLCEHAHNTTDPCVALNCLNGGSCKGWYTMLLCDCRAGFSGRHCQNVDASACGIIRNCRHCSNGECIECHYGYDLVNGTCVECPHVTPILHCEKEARSGCLFRHCEQCEPGFFRLGSGCDVCPDVGVGCRDVICTSSTNSRCINCHPGFYLEGDTCSECSGAHCMTCKDGYIFYNDACVCMYVINNTASSKSVLYTTVISVCPSREIIPDCLDIGTDGCFDQWCRKCASGFFLKGTVCDVCPNEDVGCEHVQCNSTHDAHCILCHHGYKLQNGICVRYHTGSSTPSSNVCEDHPGTDCSYLHSTIKLCEDTSRACKYCPQYCGMCDRCRYKHFGPVIG